MKIAIGLILACSLGVLVLASFSFDAATVAMMAVCIVVVSVMGSLPVVAGAVSRQRAVREQALHDAEVARRGEGSGERSPDGGGVPGEQG